MVDVVVEPGIAITGDRPRGPARCRRMPHRQVAVEVLTEHRRPIAGRRERCAGGRTPPGSYLHPKIAIAVDEDVDIYDPWEVFLAISLPRSFEGCTWTGHPGCVPPE